MEQFKIGVDMNLIIYFSSHVILNVIITLIDHSPNTAYQDQYKQIANKHRVFKIPTGQRQISWLYSCFQKSCEKKGKKQVAILLGNLVIRETDMDK